MKPEMEETNVLPEEMIAASGVTSDDPAIDFGGEDIPGDLIPSSRIEDLLGIPRFPFQF